jgi:nucleoside-diphosphate-sugar epimerase
MLVLVTGGHGFVGSSVVRRLLAGGDRVRCLVRSAGVPESLEGLGVEIVRGDVTRAETLPAALAGVGEVHHLAARVTALSEAQMRATNVTGTRLLAEAALAARTVSRFVLCSSQAVTGPSGFGPALDEAAPPNPGTWYGRSKADAEEALARVGARGLPFTIARPSSIYGPRDRALLPIFRAIARGVLPILGPQPKRHSWIYGEDVGEAMVVLARSEKTLGRTYFVAHPEPATMEVFLGTAARALGRRGVRIRIPDALLRSLAYGADLVAQATGRPGMLTRDKVHDLVPRGWVCCVDAAERDAGFRARTSLEEGIPATVAWYREHGWL